MDGDVEMISTADSKIIFKIGHVHAPVVVVVQHLTLQRNLSDILPSIFFRWTAMTLENDVGTCPYHYTDSIFYGFLATHQPAQWMGESGEIAVCPGLGEPKVAFDERGLRFSHDDEVSTPQYYKVSLRTSVQSQIIAEVSATSRSSSLRFSFDGSADESPNVVIQVTRGNINGEVFIDANNREIYGRNPERQDDVLGPFAAAGFNGYFVARFDNDFQSWGCANNSTIRADAVYGEGSTLSAFVQFPPSVKNVGMRVGVSYISINQARENLERETPNGVSLEDTANYVKKQWAEKLDLVDLPSASNDEKAIFFTGMYHALQYPSEMMEYNDSGVYYYSGFDDTVHSGVAYTGYSIWDTFRSEWAFLNLFAPERINDMITSMLQTYQQGGRLPIWQNIVETNIMIGTHSSSLIAESLAKGFKGFDMDIMWEAIWKDAMVPPEDDLNTMYFDRQPGTGCEARAGLTREKELGYVPAVHTSEAGSRTLEYAYDDYTVAVIAEITGRLSEAEFFHQRSLNYKNIFNNETMLMEARFENGSWCSNPTTWTEATDWIYTFNAQHDFPGLRDLFHGAEGLKQRLDEYYGDGHNDQTNEPSHATVFAYYFANSPSKAQSTIRSLLSENYFNSPVGLSGNDDCGQMSSWYIFNALGFYPMNPASGEYVVGTPIFSEARVRFPLSSSELTISAAGARDQPFVKSLYLDGKEVTSPVIKHSDLLHSSTLSFEMSSEPQDWGAYVL